MVGEKCDWEHSNIVPTDIVKHSCTECEKQKKCYPKGLPNRVDKYY